MLSILNRALSWAITSFGNKFCLKKRSRLIRALDNRFYVKFMQLEIGLLDRIFSKVVKFDTTVLSRLLSSFILELLVIAQFTLDTH